MAVLLFVQSHFPHGFQGFLWRQTVTGGTVCSPDVPCCFLSAVSPARPPLDSGGSKLSVCLPRARYLKSHRSARLSALPVWEARKSKIRVLADSVSGEGLLSATKTAPSSCVLPRQKQKGQHTPSGLFHEGTNATQGLWSSRSALPQHPEEDLACPPSFLMAVLSLCSRTLVVAWQALGVAAGGAEAKA